MLTEALARLRIRSAGRAAIVRLLFDAVAAEGAILAAEEGDIWSGDYQTRLPQFAGLRDQVVEIEALLGVDRLSFVMRWASQVRAALDCYHHLGLQDSLETSAPLLVSANKSLVNLRELLLLEVRLSRPLLWLWVPLQWRRLRRSRKELLKNDDSDQIISRSRHPEPN